MSGKRAWRATLGRGIDSAFGVTAGGIVSLNLFAGIDASAFPAGVILLYAVAAIRLGGRGWWRWLRLAAVCLVFFLAVGEVATRLQFPLPRNPGVLPAEDTELIFVFPPRFGFEAGEEIRLANSDGFADENFTAARPPGMRRILVLGDSIGVQADDGLTYPAILEGRLTGDRVQVYNLSCIGYNTLQEAITYERWGPRLEHDLALIVFCLNDLYPYSSFGTYYNAHLQFIELLRRRFEEPFGNFREQFSDPRLLDGIARKGLRRFKAQLGRSGVPGMVFLLPYLETAEREMVDFCLGAMERVAREEGLEVVNLTEPMAVDGLDAVAGKGRDKDRIHPNRKGHEIIAAEIEKTLIASGFLMR